ncbi:MAG: monooxygenase [Microbacteriaceae bacterium]|nr:monooxygenase [Microbacteriaceae bacterium]
MTSDVDLLVVGAGPVGLAAAIEARMLGLTVAVVEQRDTPIDKACGEGLMPGALPALARLGVSVEGRPLLGIGYRSGATRVDHRFVAGNGLGVRRTSLQAALTARAVSLGVDFVQAKVLSLRQDSDAVVAADVAARYLLGADGLHSTVRSLAGLEARLPTDRRFGLRRHFAVEPWSDLVEVHWTPVAEAYVTPVSDGIVGVAILGKRGLGYSEALAAIPAIASRIAGADAVSTLRGAGPFRQRTSARRAGRVLLVGDASGYVDAITGEGIRVGLAQAHAAIECIAADAPERYEREWSRRTRDFRMLTVGLVALAGSPLRSAIVPTAAALPGVFGAIVERLAR